MDPGRFWKDWMEVEMESERVEGGKNKTKSETVNDESVHDHLKDGSPPNIEDIENEDKDFDRESKRPRLSTSKVWDHFMKIGIKDGKEKAKCNACGTEYVAGGMKIGTSTMLRHLSKCSVLKKLKDNDIGKMIIDHAGKLRSREIDQKVVNDLISMVIIQHGLPYNFFEYKWIKELLLYLNPEVRVPSRNTVVSNISKKFHEHKERVKLAMCKSHSRICLTSDCWTSINQEGFICLTAHFVDASWRLNSKIIAFCKMEPPHIGHDLAQKIVALLLDWEIDRKIFSITLDNPNANEVLQKILSEQLKLCSAHVLNIIVQEGLKVASVALQKIKESIKYVRGSEARKIAFKECVIQVRGIDTKVGLKMDVPTRWNSTYLMLESAIRYRRAFGSLAIRDRNYFHYPSNDEWKKAEKMCEFLKPFYVMTNLISGSSYPTSNRYFMQVWKIECLLRENVKSDDMTIKNMSLSMMNKFSKYWDQYYDILAIGAILDPWMKFEAIRFCYRKINPSTFEEKINVLKDNMHKLFEEYVKLNSNESNTSSSQVAPPT
ncbi:zinc finger BED domain-containing protein RICESLEEPER 2-like [Vigna angularis]|uniref:zinc finger BED domain-containing protein RICESLEEPER 2-like n=1 Tax=Phaseolus angularis TaxID=3914 RepID=UPI000809D270|nr:zinc finger BED domain-containing protein RICESLEEPER 2-like [Vigna angularis]